MIDEKKAQFFMNEILGQFCGLRTLFDRVEIAEEAIKCARRKYKSKSELLNKCFMILCPTEVFGHSRNEIYRNHCDELLRRVAKAKKITEELILEPTEAEIILHMSNLSLTAPPGSDFARAYYNIFEKILPEQAKLMMEPYESYEGRANEIIQEFRRKIKSKRDLTSLKECGIIVSKRGSKK